MSGTTREVVTLQLGHYSNFVGTHWWNIQESSFIYHPSEVTGPKEINHDVLFREGKNLVGDITYTPRLVAFDLKGSLKTLRQEGVLYDVPDPEGDDLKWSSDVNLHRSESAHKNEFLQDLDSEEGQNTDNAADTEADNCDKDVEECGSEAEAQPPVFGSKLYHLDDSVEVWSDFLRLHLHPKSVTVIPKYTHSIDDDTFDVFGYGGELISDRLLGDEMEDKIHFFLEECDHLQGLQVLTDIHNGFGGLSSAVVQQLEDDYSTKGIFTSALYPSSFTKHSTQQDTYRLLNSALSFDKLCCHSSAFLPLSLATTTWRKGGANVCIPYLSYKTNLAYHTSAVLAATLDTLTIPYRLETSPSLMTHITDALTARGRKVLCAQTSLPFPIHEESTLVHSLLQMGDVLPWQSVTPYGVNGAPAISQSVVLRGIHESLFPRRPDPSIPTALSSCSTPEELMNLYLSESCKSSLNAACVLRTPCHVNAPYPHIFSSSVTSDGLLGSRSRPSTMGVEKVPMMSALQCSPQTSVLLHSLHTEVSKVNIKKFHKFIENGVEEDEFSELLHNLQGLEQLYDTQYSDMS